MNPKFDELDEINKICGTCGIWDDCMGDEKKLERMYDEKEDRQLDRLLDDKKEWDKEKDVDCWRPAGALLVWEEIEI